MGSSVVRLLGSLVLVLGVAEATQLRSNPATQLPSDPATSLCKPAAELAPIRGVAEASGIAVSHRTPGLLWTHNDSGAPLLHAIDASGTVKGHVQVTGAHVVDWEDLAVAPCRGGSCLYIADIGDNNRSRRIITIYRIPEPRPDQSASEPAEVWNATYPDGAHDAEAFFAAGNALFIVTKDESSATALYLLPLLPKGGHEARLELVSRLALDRVTGAGVSPDGMWVALRTNDTLLFYRTQDLIEGRTGTPQQFDITGVDEPQGEGVAIGREGFVYLAGEGGGRGGTLAALRCTLR
jgi:hypothetical protein